MAHATKWRSYRTVLCRRHLASIAVWLVALMLVVGLFSRRNRRIELTGIAHSEQKQVAALTDGRLLMVPVGLFEKVQQGQTLAVLEDDKIQAQLATAAAETARLRAELSVAQSRLTAEVQAQESKLLAEARQFAFGVQRIRLSNLELKVVLETDRIALERWHFKLDRLLQLHRKDAAEVYELEMAQTKHAVLKKTIEENEKVLAQLQLDLQQVLQRQKEFAASHPVPPSLEKVLEPWRATLAVQELLIAELSMERSMLVMRSPLDGVVSDVFRGAGEALMSGEPILTVTAAQPSEIVTYASAAQVSEIEPGMVVELVKQYEPRQTAPSKVIAVGPAAVQLPIRSWRNPNSPEWGWPVLIAAAAELKLRSGELVGIRGL